jgi:acetyl-CoA C-acetyltransferase
MAGEAMFAIGGGVESMSRVPMGSDGAAWAMERLYRFFLRWRPALQRWASRLDQPDTPR